MTFPKTMNNLELQGLKASKALSNPNVQTLKTVTGTEINEF